MKTPRYRLGTCHTYACRIAPVARQCSGNSTSPSTFHSNPMRALAISRLTSFVRLGRPRLAISSTDVPSVAPSAFARFCRLPVRRLSILRRAGGACQVTKPGVVRSARGQPVLVDRRRRYRPVSVSHRSGPHCSLEETRKREQTAANCWRFIIKSENCKGIT